MSLDTLLAVLQPPFAWREYVVQTWFIARVSTLAALVLTIPYAVLLTFTINSLLTEIGAADFSGTGASIAVVSQIGPVGTVLVISGAAATAICADLGARNIREELDALRVMGIDPIRTLVLPRVAAATTVALALGSSVIIFGLIVTFAFSVFVQNVSAGAFVDHLTLLTGTGDVVVSMVKSMFFGLTAGLIGCYKGVTAGGGPAGVGTAVNETVVFSFVALFAINTIVTAVGIQITVS
ncbi:MlaE family ABC transporter permease [[Mycobacterium] burgundiense]|uniref:ABC transporter permease n=1 Tax=[Mycobacterium] burgundiense TaxID=3064286 RepID=A0ABM9M7L0_9MYCO|nr:ABC transporter permease [Mycolicibacterium sp. MU0053]CAJ1511166.1 ABC transporter permease [Mycolicibacterium sp. MU0053]